MNQPTDEGILIQDRIRSILDQMHVPFVISTHEPVFTMEQAAQVSGHQPQEGIKCLLLKVYKTKREKDFVLAVWRGDRQVELDKVAKVKGGKESKIATPDEVRQVLHIDIGALAPFGYKEVLPVIFDKTILQTKRAFINPGKHNQTLGLSSEDLLRAIQQWSNKTAVQI